MRFFIRVENGLPVDHPISSENLQKVIPEFDGETPPNGFSEFIRTPAPAVGVYEAFEQVTYEASGDNFIETHHIRQMTSEEIKVKKDAEKLSWSSSGMAENGFSTWVFNEETCSYVAPVSKPNDGNSYVWNDETVSWELEAQD